MLQRAAVWCERGSNGPAEWTYEGRSEPEFSEVGAPGPPPVIQGARIFVREASASAFVRVKPGGTAEAKLLSQWMGQKLFYFGKGRVLFETDRIQAMAARTRKPADQTNFDATICLKGF